MLNREFNCTRYKLPSVYREGLKKHQTATTTTTIVENFETEVLGMLTLIDADSLACACEILSLDVLKQKKGNLKLSKYILRQFNSEDAESSDDGSSS